MFIAHVYRTSTRYQNLVSISSLEKPEKEQINGSQLNLKARDKHSPD